MSDFGSLIEVHRLDGQNMEVQDRKQLEQAIQIIQATDKYEDVNGKPFSFVGWAMPSMFILPSQTGQRFMQVLCQNLRLNSDFFYGRALKTQKWI
jgi:hypothetical protein